MPLSKELNLPGAQKKTRGVLKRHIGQIQEWFDEGYTKKDVFEYLKQENVITCKYDHFRKTINKLLDNSIDHTKLALSHPKSSDSVKPKGKGFELKDYDENMFK